MSISPPSKVSHTRLATIQRTRTRCNYSCLTRSIGEKVLEDATANTYEQVKAKAISVTASQRIISAMYGRTQSNFRRPPYQGNWQQRSFRPPNTQPGPGFTRNAYNHPQQTRQGFGQTSYNSSTAPRAWNNQPVPMDVDRARAPRGNWRGRGGGQTRGNVVRTDDNRAQRGI